MTKGLRVVFQNRHKPRHPTERARVGAGAGDGGWSVPNNQPAKLLGTEHTARALTCLDDKPECRVITHNEELLERGRGRFPLLAFRIRQGWRDRWRGGGQALPVRRRRWRARRRGGSRSRLSWALALLRLDLRPRLLPWSVPVRRLTLGIRADLWGDVARRNPFVAAALATVESHGSLERRHGLALSITLDACLPVEYIPHR